MKVADFTGVAEKLGIVLSSPAHVLAVKCSTPIVEEEIEIVLVDFLSGKEEPVLRKTKMFEIRQLVEMGNLSTDIKQCLFELADDQDLELNANKVIRVNLTTLTAGSTYKVFGIQSNSNTENYASVESMIIGSGVNTQRFPIKDASQLILPEANLSDIRIIWSNGKEQRLTTEELQIIRTANTTSPAGRDIFVVDTIDVQKGLKVSEIEVNLSAATGYTILKVKNIETTGFHS